MSLLEKKKTAKVGISIVLKQTWSQGTTYTTKLYKLVFYRFHMIFVSFYAELQPLSFEISFLLKYSEITNCTPLLTRKITVNLGKYRLGNMATTFN